MKWSRDLGLEAFTIVELVVALGIIALMAALVGPAIVKQRQSARRTQCMVNLKQIGQAFGTREINGGDGFLTQASTNREAAFGRVTSGQAYGYFQVMSNELHTPKVLVCPADVRVPAKDFGPGFSNVNLSYFVNLDAGKRYADMLLYGDRNLTNGLPIQEGILVLMPNRPAGWTHELHDCQGNVALGDGSIQGLSRRLLSAYLVGVTNRLAMP